MKLWFRTVGFVELWCRRPGLSKFFGGKSQSFSSLADVSSVSDLAKPNNPYAKRRRMMGPLVNASQTSLDRHRSYPPLSRTSVASFSKKPASNRSTNTLTIALKLGSLREAAAAEEQEDEEEEDYVHADLPAAAQGSSRIGGHMTRTTPSRSFSLTDLPLVGLPPPPPSSSSTPFRNSFAYHGPWWILLLTHPPTDPIFFPCLCEDKVQEHSLADRTS